MQVILSSKTLGVIYLAYGGRQSPRNLRINASRAIQEVELLRAPYLQLFDRGNQRNEVTFDVLDNTGAIGSTANAEGLAMLAAGRCGRGVIIFNLQNGTQLAGVRFMSPAIVQSVNVEHIGIMIIYSYRIIGGSIFTRAPAIPL